MWTVILIVSNLNIYKTSFIGINVDYSFFNYNSLLDTTNKTNRELLQYAILNICKLILINEYVNYKKFMKMSYYPMGISH